MMGKMVGQEKGFFLECRPYVTLLETSLMAIWSLQPGPKSLFVGKNSRCSLPLPRVAPLNLQTQGHARNWTRGPKKSNLPVLVLPLNFKWLRAVILLTAELLSETKELWHSSALSNCAFSAHLQIQHETWSAPNRRGDCAERKHAETSRRNTVGLSGRKDQMCGQVRQQLVWWTDFVGVSAK